MSSNGGENCGKTEVFGGSRGCFAVGYRNVRIISIFSALRERASTRLNYLHTKNFAKNNRTVLIDLSTRYSMLIAVN